MKSSRLFPILLLIPGLAFSAPSPTPTPVPTPDPNALERTAPNPPFLANAPNPGMWGYTYSYPEERVTVPKVVAPTKKPDAKPTPDVKPVAFKVAGRLESVDVARGNNVIHVEMARHSEDRVETWRKGQEEYTKTDVETDWTASTADGGFDSASLAMHFPPIDWLSATTYVGTIPYAGVKCDVFIKDLDPKLKVVDQKTLEIALSKSQYIAFIDNKTRNPVEVREQGVFIVFAFHAPSKSLGFPQDLLTQIDQGIKVQKSMAQRAPRPY